MKKHIAALVAAAVVAHSTPLFAMEAESKAPAKKEAGPLLKASLNIPVDTNTEEAGPQEPPGTRDQRSWIERHPVWTGVIGGYAAGFGLTYLTTDEGGIPGQGAAALFWGGVGAGIGALLGWAISRNQDDDYSANRRRMAVAPSRLTGPPR